MCWGGPYPLFVVSYFFIGLGVGWQDAQANSLASRLPNNTVVMFVLHAIYGLGATVSPFVSTAFLQQLPNVFYYYFTISLALALATVVALVVTFQWRTEDQVVGKFRWIGGKQVGVVGEEKDVPVPMPDAGAGMEGQRRHLERDGEVGETGVEQASRASVGADVEAEDKAERAGATKLREIVTSPRAFCLAFYIFAYVSAIGW
jgi:MFS family permease